MINEDVVKIKLLNASTAKIICAKHIMNELSNTFKYYAKDYKFMPKYKAGIWDGIIRLINYDGTTRAGLVGSVCEFCKENGYKIQLEKESFAKFYSKELPDTTDFIESLSLPYDLHDHQLQSFQDFLKFKRLISLVATGGGKSLIAYLACRYLKHQKILFLVPDIGLTKQMFADFKEYSENNGWNVEENVHVIADTTSHIKDSEKQIYLSTWQSLYRLPKEYFLQFDCVICDEVHKSKATQITNIMNNCTNAWYRIGMTGTLEDFEVDQKMMIGLFGKIFHHAKSLDLIDKDILTNVEIRPIVLKHESAPRTIGLYKEEIDYIISSESRNSFLCKFINSLNGNTIVLCRFIDNHLEKLHKQFIEMFPNKKVYLIHGGIHSDEREAIRNQLEHETDAILFATLATCSTGINIKTLKNLVIAHPTKSKTAILQSIGRILRKHKLKDKCYAFDIVDDLSHGRKTKNRTFLHFIDRMGYYMEEGHVVKSSELSIQ